MSRSPTLGEVIKTAIEARLLDVHVSLPGKVVRYDPVKQLVDVQPLIRGFYTDENEQEQKFSMKVITNVPVCFPGAGGYRVTFPVAVGDTICILFSERSLDTWLATGGEVDEIDMRRFNLSDGIAILGLRPFSSPLRDAPIDQATIGFDGGQLLRLKQAAIELGNAASEGVALGDTLKTFLDSLVAYVAGHKHQVTGVNAGGASVTSQVPNAAPPNCPTVASVVAKVTP